jgi:hypothetical protein
MIIREDATMGRETVFRRSRAWYGWLAAWGAAAVLWGLASCAMAETSQLAQKAPDAAEMLATAQRQGYVRVIMQFQLPSPPNPGNIDAVKAQVAALQDAIIAAHLGASPGFERGLTKFEITPAFAANVTAAELAALAADPRVQTINLDRAVPPAAPRPGGR